MKNSLMFLLLLCLPAFGDHYCSSTAAGGGAGTLGDPWTIAEAQTEASLTNGETVWTKGNFAADITFDNTKAIGAAGALITYRAWPGETAPQCTQLHFNGTYSAYLVFNGWTIDPGEGVAWKDTIDLGGASYVDFIGCTITGFRSTFGDPADAFYPYYLGDPSTGYVGLWNLYVVNAEAGASTYITFTNCTFQHGWRAFRTGANNNNWTISNCTFTRCGEDFLNISAADSITISNCTFSDARNHYAVWYYSAGATGVWASEDACFVDDDGDSTKDAAEAALRYVTATNDSTLGACHYFVVNDAANYPNRSASYTIRKTSDPTNVYSTISTRIMTFTSGGTHEVLVGDTLTGATSGQTAVVNCIYVSSGTWAGGNAAGKLGLITVSGAFTSGENFNEGANNDVLTMTSNVSTSIADNTHNDSVSIDQTADTILIDSCLFENVTLPQAIKVDTGPTNVTIQNCVIDYASTTSGYAILLQGSATTANLYNNTIVSRGNALYGIRYNGGTYAVYNNIISGGVNTTGTVTSDYNIYSTVFLSGAEANGLQSQTFTSGMFSNYSSQDFALVAGSPALNIGSATYAPADDFRGTARPQGAADDVGAYELIGYNLAQQILNLEQ